MPTKIQLRRGTSAQWSSVNPLLASGEVGYETDTKQFKIGDGSTYWNSLQYSNLSESGVQSLIDAHADRTDNPHSVTKAQVGLSNVDNTSDANKPISSATQSALNLKYDANNPSSYVNASQAAEAAPVQSVAGKTGIVTLTKTDVGLSNVPNVDATQRSNHTGTQTSSTISDFSSSVDSRIELQKGVGLGLATLDSGGKVPSSQLPSTIMEYKGTWSAVANSPTLQNGSLNNSSEDIGNVYVVSSPGTINFGAGAITFDAGDWVILNSSFIWEKSVNSNLVSSVNGYQGTVVLTKADVGLSNVDNTSDVNKPISTATQTALNLKYDASNPSGYVNTAGAAAAAPVQSVAGRTGTVTLTKSDVGLANVPNVDATSRANHIGTQLASTISDFTTAVQAVTIDAAKIDGGNVSNAEFATLDGIITGVSIQSQIDSKQATITGAASTITTTDLTIDRALVSNATGKVAVSSVSSNELGYVSGVTSAIQTQLNSKEPTITAGTASQYWRGDKSFQTLNAAAVTNTPAGNISSTTVQAALNELDTEKEPVISVTANRALASDSTGKVSASATTSTELGYVSGVTSAIQTQIDGKRGFLGIQTLTAGTIYTPTAGTTYIEATLVGAGGGGGGVSGANTSIGAGGGGGSGAVLTVAVALTGAATYTYSIGTAGTAGTGAATPTAGGLGGSTTLTIGATTYTAAGGSGGAAQTAGTAAALVLGGAGGALPTGGSVNIPGIAGSNGFRSSGTIGFSGAGASSPYGAGGSVPTTAGAGNSGTGYGSGGSGGYSTANANRAGGAGSAGVIIIREYK